MYKWASHVCIQHYFIFMFVTSFIAKILEDTDTNVTEAHEQISLVLWLLIYYTININQNGHFLYETTLVISLDNMHVYVTLGITGEVHLKVDLERHY